MSSLPSGEKYWKEWDPKWTLVSNGEGAVWGQLLAGGPEGPATLTAQSSHLKARPGVGHIC